MGVFPAASKKHVPAPWAKLMTEPVCITIREMVKKHDTILVYFYDRINMALQTIILLLITYSKQFLSLFFLISFTLKLEADTSIR